MGRWEPDAPGRLMHAAIELFADQGFERTTVADIAERAGVTERTFFRYFTDKREVLFDRTDALQQAVVAAIADAPTAAPIDVVGAAMQQAGTVLDEERRAHARRRAVAIDANPGLQERELLKMAALGSAVAGAMRARGVPEPTATLAAEAGVTAFRLGFTRWIADPPTGTLAECVAEALTQLKAVTTGG